MKTTFRTAAITLAALLAAACSDSPVAPDAAQQPRAEVPGQPSRLLTNAEGDEMVRHAANKIGTPYSCHNCVYQLGDARMNCSGLVMYAYYKTTGRNIQANVYEQATMGVRLSRSELRRGDLVFTDNNNGVAIYAGNGVVIMASSYWGEVRRIEMQYLNVNQFRRLP